MTDINWDSMPKYNIDCGKIATPAFISTILEHYNVDKYLYRIMYKGIVIKYGMSADNSKTYGERIYRQIGHLESWGPLRLTGSSGSDFRITETDFVNTYGFPLHKDHIKVHVWDVTKYQFKSVKPRREILEMESSLILRYKELTGEKPIGNLNDEANYYGKPYIPKEIAAGLFDNFPGVS